MSTEPSKNATRGEEVRQVRRTVAVSLAFVRAKCLLELLLEEIGDPAREELPAPTEDDWKFLRVNRATRSTALIVVYYAALNATIDGWRRNHLTDSVIDRLIASHHASTLKGFRDALFHPTAAA